MLWACGPRAAERCSRTGNPAGRSCISRWYRICTKVSKGKYEEHLHQELGLGCEVRLRQLLWQLLLQLEFGWEELHFLQSTQKYLGIHIRDDFTDEIVVRPYLLLTGFNLGLELLNPLLQQINVNLFALATLLGGLAVAPQDCLLVFGLRLLLTVGVLLSLAQLRDFVKVAVARGFPFYCFAGAVAWGRL